MRRLKLVCMTTWARKRWIAYRVCYARILDLKRRFLEAGLRYYDLDQKTSNWRREIDEEVLQQAVTCIWMLLAHKGLEYWPLFIGLYPRISFVVHPRLHFVVPIVMRSCLDAPILIHPCIVTNASDANLEDYSLVTILSEFGLTFVFFRCILCLDIVLLDL